MSPFWLLFCLINLSEATHMAYAMLRAKKRHMYMHNRNRPPIATTARFIAQPESSIVATPEGRLIISNNDSHSDSVSELLGALECADLGAFTSLLNDCGFISQREAFLIYRHILMMEAWSFEGPLLQICKPVLLSPILASFALKNTHLLGHINLVFSDADLLSWQRLLLQELLLHNDIPEENVRIVLESVNVNIPLLNGYPLIYHFIYYKHLPSYYLTALISIEALDLHPKPLIGENPAEWSNLPLLLHALMYNYEAFCLLRSKMEFQDLLPTFDQVIGVFV